MPLPFPPDPAALLPTACAIPLPQHKCMMNASSAQHARSAPPLRWRWGRLFGTVARAAAWHGRFGERQRSARVWSICAGQGSVGTEEGRPTSTVDRRSDTDTLMPASPRARCRTSAATPSCASGAHLRLKPSKLHPRAHITRPAPFGRGLLTLVKLTMPQSTRPLSATTTPGTSRRPARSEDASAWMRSQMRWQVWGCAGCGAAVGQPPWAHIYMYIFRRNKSRREMLLRKLRGEI